MANNVEFIGLTKFGEDLVKGLSLLEDPSHIHRIGDGTYFLKHWKGTLNGETVNVFENIQTTYNDGNKIYLYSHLHVHSKSGTIITAEWMNNPFLDNSQKKHDKNSGHYKFR